GHRAARVRVLARARPARCRQGRRGGQAVPHARGQGQPGCIPQAAVRQGRLAVLRRVRRISQRHARGAPAGGCPAHEARGREGVKIKDLIASSWETIAVEQWRSGQTSVAATSLKTAEKYAASGDSKRRLAMDRTALQLDKKDLGPLEALGGNPPESLVNLGIVYELLGRPKDAYDAWVKAKQRGVASRELQKWIDAQKPIYGY